MAKLIKMIRKFFLKISALHQPLLNNCLMRSFSARKTSKMYKSENAVLTRYFITVEG